MQLRRISSKEFGAFASRMSRMNGGTNIALALSKACTIGNYSEEEEEEEEASLSQEGTKVPHLVLMLTDGRVDSYQASAAAAAARELSERDLQLFAFAVGRSVDFDQLERLSSGKVMTLRTLDEPPW